MKDNQSDTSFNSQFTRTSVLLNNLWGYSTE